MDNERLITHQEFIDGYKSGKISVYIEKDKAGGFVLSPQADKHNKPAYLFWSWGGIFVAYVLTFILLFVNWRFSIISFIVGLLIVSANRKSGAQCVLQNMLDDEDFWMYVILHQGAKMTDTEGRICFPKESVRLHKSIVK